MYWFSSDLLHRIIRDAAAAKVIRICVLMQALMHRDKLIINSHQSL